MRAVRLTALAAAIAVAAAVTTVSGAISAAAAITPSVIWHSASFPYSSAPTVLPDGRIAMRTGQGCGEPGAIVVLTSDGRTAATYNFETSPDPPVAVGNALVFGLGCSGRLGVINLATGVNQTLPAVGYGWCYKPPVIVDNGAAATFVCEQGVVSVQLNPFQIINQASGLGSMRQRPLLSGGMLVSGSQSGVAYAAHPTSLNTYWEKSLGGGSIVACATKNVVIAGVVGSSSLYGLSLNGQGAQLWSVQLPSSIQGADPVCNDDHAIVILPGAALKISEKDGSTVWNATLPGESSSAQLTPAITDTAVYVFSAGLVVGIDMATGATLWSVPGVGDHTNSFYNEGPAVAGENVVVGLDAGVVAIQANAATPAPTTAQTVTELVCSDDQCKLACTLFTVPMGCADTSSGSGAAVSVRRSCSAASSSFIVETFDGTTTCSASGAVATSTARYPLGSCVPLPTGGYLRTYDCTAK